MVSIDKNHPIKLLISFIIEKAGLAVPIVKFSSDQPTNQQHEMEFEYGANYLLVQQIRLGSEVFVNFPESCADSIHVYFPYGGTYSGASLYADSTAEHSLRSISYGIGEEGNYLGFSKKDIGRYYVRYGACHWNKNFWLTIKQITNCSIDIVGALTM